MTEQPPQRSTRVQIAILENRQVILVQTLVKRENRTFWGLPGGGIEPGESEEETARREAREETGLEIELLPFRLVSGEIGRTRVYKQLVTYLAYPVSGEAKTGIEPEPEMQSFFQLVGLRWHDLYVDDGLDEFTVAMLRPVRTLVDGPAFLRRAGTITYRYDDDQPRLLMVTSKTNPHIWIFPQGKLDPGETAEEAALRETREESGMDARITRPLGFQLSSGQPDPVRTDFYLAEWVDEHEMQENRQRRWATIEEALALELPTATRRLLRELDL